MALDDRDELLEHWLDRWEDAREGGETLAPEVLCQDQPELLPELKRRIQELVRLDGFLEPAHTDVEANEPFVEIQAGRYRAKRLHAPGGLGEVFYANDDELNREVALKRLRPSISWSREARRRFVLEAEITGRLEHPGVVPVYGLGRDQSGNPYYAMRFIRGKTLDQATEDLRKTPIDPDKQLQGLRSLLSALRSACQTIAYAHAHGVLHRDLKPGNIILGDYGEVLVIDWGLAKTWDPAAPAPPAGEHPVKAEPSPSPPNADPDETAAFHLDATEIGQIKGTPAYMSPEQAEGNPASPASDIYGLGATLYKILTGTAPFKGETPLIIVRKVRENELLAPRMANPAVHPALNAVCLKAMHKNPAQRYATALEFAQDLANWLDDVPTLAWPEPWHMRAQRWVRKNNSTVVGIAAAFFVFLVAAGFWTIRERALVNELQAAVKSANDERARAELQGKRADQNYVQARTTVQQMLYKTNHPRWNDVPKIKQLQTEQTELVLAFFDKIASQPGQEPSVRKDVAWALIEAGRMQIWMGKLAAGKEKLRQAMALTEALYDGTKADPGMSVLRSDALLAHGAYFEAHENALPVLEKSVAVLELSLQKHPQATYLRSFIADSLITLGAALVQQKKYEEAEAPLLRSITISQEILKDQPDDVQRLAICSKARVNLSAAYRQGKKGELSREQHVLAERDFEALLQLDSYHRDAIEGLAVLRLNGAYDLAAEGKKGAAIENLRRSMPMLEAAIKLEPDDAMFRDRIYRTYGLAAEFLRQDGKQREAAELWEKSLSFASAGDRPLRLVEAVEYWMDASDNRRALEAATRAQAEIPVKPAFFRHWQRHKEALERLATLVEKDELIPADERPKLVAKIRADVVQAHEHAEGPAAPLLEFFRSLIP